VQILTQQKQVVLRDETFTEKFEGDWASISGDTGAAALRRPF
jgi:hypothetical protein